MDIKYIMKLLVDRAKNIIENSLQENHLLLIQDLNILKIIDVKLLRTSGKRVFHFKTHL